MVQQFKRQTDMHCRGGQSVRFRWRHELRRNHLFRDLHRRHLYWSFKSDIRLYAPEMLNSIDSDPVGQSFR